MDLGSLLEFATVAGLAVVVIVFLGIWFGNRAVEAIEDLEDDAP